MFSNRQVWRSGILHADYPRISSSRQYLDAVQLHSWPAISLPKSFPDNLQRGVYSDIHVHDALPPSCLLLWLLFEVSK